MKTLFKTLFFGTLIVVFGFVALVTIGGPIAQAARQRKHDANMAEHDAFMAKHRATMKVLEERTAARATKANPRSWATTQYTDEEKLTAQILGEPVDVVARAFRYNDQGRSTAWVLKNDPAASRVYLKAAAELR